MKPVLIATIAQHYAVLVLTFDKLSNTCLLLVMANFE